MIENYCDFPKLLNYKLYLICFIKKKKYRDIYDAQKPKKLL